MTLRLIAAVALSVCTPALRGQPAQPVLPGPAIPLPGVSGRIDHMAIDPGHKRLYIAAIGNGSVEAVDLAAGQRTASAPGLSEPQGALYIASPRKVAVACGGDGTVRALDADTLKETQRLSLGDDADNIRLGPDAQIYVGYGDGALAILDPGPLAKVGEIKLPGHPEAFALEASGPRIFVNIPGGPVLGGGRITVADRTARAATTDWKPKGGRNFPMALDEPGHRLFIGCRSPARIAILDTQTGQTTATLDCAGDADDLFYDAKTGRLYLTAGEGFLDIFSIPPPAPSDAAPPARLAHIPTAPGARTGLLCPDLNALYIAIPRRAQQQAEIRTFTLQN